MPPSNVDAKYSSYTSSDKLKQQSPNTADKETIIVFDWDDTLLASSFLSSKGYRLDTDKSKLADVEAGLRDLEQAIIAVVTLALQYGEVHIVTNAETGWVQLSAAKFIPAVVPLLHRVSILSARSTYEGRYPDAPLKWKYDTASNTALRCNLSLTACSTSVTDPLSLVSVVASAGTTLSRTSWRPLSLSPSVRKTSFRSATATWSARPSAPSRAASPTRAARVSSSPSGRRWSS